MKRSVNFLIQASSRSWQGSVDSCLTDIQGLPAIERTINKIKDHFSGCPITIIAPEFDKVGVLNQFQSKNDLRIIYGHDASPAHRIEEATRHLSGDDVFVRLDGLHFCFFPEHVAMAIEKITSEKLDLVKMPDDFPAQISFEVFTRAGYQKLFDSVSEFPATYLIHIKHLHHLLPNVKKAFLEVPPLKDGELRKIRESMSPIYHIPRGLTFSKGIAAGDQLSFHYDLVLPYLAKGHCLLDVACGDGTGSLKVSEKVEKVFAVDIDSDQISKNVKEKKKDNVEFVMGDAEKLSFASEKFDVITSMETIEHCNDYGSYLSEMNRVLKKGGYLFLSTPQNKYGKVPLNSAHVYEFSESELRSQINNCGFTIEKFVGIKSGRVFIDGDASGANSFVICRKL